MFTLSHRHWGLDFRETPKHYLGWENAALDTGGRSWSSQAPGHPVAAAKLDRGIEKQFEALRLKMTSQGPGDGGLWFSSFVILLSLGGTGDLGSTAQ